MRLQSAEADDSAIASKELAALTAQPAVAAQRTSEHAAIAAARQGATADVEQ
jgi:hypothetical protein